MQSVKINWLSVCKNVTVGSKEMKDTGIYYFYFEIFETISIIIFVKFHKKKYINWKKKKILLRYSDRVCGRRADLKDALLHITNPRRTLMLPNLLVWGERLWVPGTTIWPNYISQSAHKSGRNRSLFSQNKRGGCDSFVYLIDSLVVGELEVTTRLNVNRKS